MCPTVPNAKKTLYLLYMCLPGTIHMLLVLPLGKTPLKHKIAARIQAAHHIQTWQCREEQKLS